MSYMKTLDELAAERSLAGQNAPHFKVGSAPSAIITDLEAILYVVNRGSGLENGSISVINVDSTKVSSIPN